MVVQRVLLGGRSVEFTVTYYVLHQMDVVELPRSTALNLMMGLETCNGKDAVDIWPPWLR